MPPNGPHLADTGAWKLLPQYTTTSSSDSVSWQNNFTRPRSWKDENNSDHEGVTFSRLSCAESLLDVYADLVNDAGEEAFSEAAGTESWRDRGEDGFGDYGGREGKGGETGWEVTGHALDHVSQAVMQMPQAATEYNDEGVPIIHRPSVSTIASSYGSPESSGYLDFRLFGTSNLDLALTAPSDSLRRQSSASGRSSLSDISTPRTLLFYDGPESTWSPYTSISPPPSPKGVSHPAVNVPVYPLALPSRQTKSTISSQPNIISTRRTVSFPPASSNTNMQKQAFNPSSSTTSTPRLFPFPSPPKFPEADWFNSRTENPLFVPSPPRQELLSGMLPTVCTREDLHQSRSLFRNPWTSRPNTTAPQISHQKSPFRSVSDKLRGRTSATRRSHSKASESRSENSPSRGSSFAKYQIQIVPKRASRDNDNSPPSPIPQYSLASSRLHTVDHLDNHSYEQQPTLPKNDFPPLIHRQTFAHTSFGPSDLPAWEMFRNPFQI